MKNVASILQRTFRGEKHFFQANEGKVIPFTVVITPLIYSWLNPTKWIFSCFRVVSTSTTSTTYKSLSVLRFRSTFSIFFSRSWQNCLRQNAVEDMTFASVDRPCLFVMVKHSTFAHALYHTLHVMITEELMSSFLGQWVWSREDKGEREGIPHTHPIP